MTINHQQLTILLLAPLVALFVGGIVREDSAKKSLVEYEYGFPHFAFLFWNFGLFENPKFSSFAYLTLTIPGLQIVEVWQRLVGPFWFRLGWRGMTAEEIESYYWRVHARMEEKRAKMGQGQGPKPTEPGVLGEPPNDQL